MYVFSGRPSVLITVLLNGQVFHFTVCYRTYLVRYWPDISNLLECSWWFIIMMQVNFWRICKAVVEMVLPMSEMENKVNTYINSSRLVLENFWDNILFQWERACSWLAMSPMSARQERWDSCHVVVIHDF